MSDITLQVIGGGNMGAALVGGLISAGWPAETIGVVERLPARAAELTATLPGVNVLAEPVPADGVVIAVKPHDVRAAAHSIAELGAQRVLSLAAGVSLASLQRACGPSTAIVRAMPNTPALVGKGVAAMASSVSSSPEDVEWARRVLGAVGTVVEVTEPQLDAVTGFTGSGPAYLFLVLEALIDGAVLAGLPRPLADGLAQELLVGSAALLAADGRGPSALRAAVTSPGGTTAAGLRELEKAATRYAFLQAVQASANRSRELGEVY